MAELELATQQVEVAQAWLIEDATVEALASEDLVAELKRNYELRIGDRPFVRSVRKLYETNGRSLPPEAAALPGETYVVTHAVGVTVVDGAARKVDTVGYRTSFDDPGSTIELAPSTRFKEWFTAGGKFEAGLSAEGYLEAPPELSALVAGAAGIPLGAGAEIHLATEANVVGKVSVSIKTPVIQAVGTASSSAGWQFERGDDPLAGDQVMLQTVVVPRGQESMTFSLQGYAVIDPSWYRRPVRIETPPIEVEVELEG